ncbi:MAG: D-alanyl-D-alanine carboxypeptidase/D-alanyl-D-alanine-endopeptidase [Phycisphaerales bacterium]
MRANSLNAVDSSSPLRVIALALCVVAVVLLAPVRAAAQPLDSRLDSLIQRSKLGKTKIAVCAMEAATGQVLMSKSASDPMIPASNMKLLTAGAAVMVLGTDFTFRTELVWQPEARRFVIRGSGDPALADPKLLGQMNIGVEDLIRHWTTEARKVAGPEGADELVVDDRIFDREFRHPSWPGGQANRWYCAEVSGLMFYANLLAIFPQPQGQGSPAVLKTEPSAPWLELRNKTRSVRQGQQTVWAAWTGTGEVSVHGDVRYATDPIELSLNNSPEFVARLALDRFRRAGVPVKSARIASENESLAGGQVVQVMQTRLEDVLNRCNMDSYNLYAEALFKRMGHEVSGGAGSFRNGASVVRMKMVEKLGAEAGRLMQVADGSGMSRNNRVTASLLARWLAAMTKEGEAGRMFIRSIPGPGEGTMERRFDDKRLKGEVRAKSGYISGVSTLSGYITSKSSGRRVVFSILANDIPGNVGVARIKEFHEDVVALCDKWLADDESGE